MITARGLIKLGFTPEIDFVLQDDSDGNGAYVKEWLSTTAQPSDAEIATADTQAQAEYDSKQYARDRAEAYPSIADQLDDIYHNGVTGWKTSIKAVKDQFPKA
jgi:hypothetical protein